MMHRDRNANKLQGCALKPSCSPFRYLPREVDPLVYNMSHEDPGNVSYSEIGGLSEQIRELREVQHLPLKSAASCAFLTVHGGVR